MKDNKGSIYMKIAIPWEALTAETRIAASPDSVKKLTTLGAEVMVESQLGQHLGWSNETFTLAGAKVIDDRQELLAQADIVLRLHPSPSDEIALVQKGAWHISYLSPFDQQELVQALAAQGVTSVSMQMIPRTTLAQKMDALSSQANLGGYMAVILAAEESPKIFPMMTTAAGTISPAKVFVIGVGVAGLQAIATAKRLGARVEAYDTRPVVEEQVQSLGAKFVKIDVGETGQTAGGYAKALTEKQLQMQREAMAKVCASSDIVITTAQVFGRKPPVLVTEEILASMQPGSVVVDMAAETGGNVVGSKPDQLIDVNGVKIIGYGNLPGRVPLPTSEMYASNLYHFVSHFWDKEALKISYVADDEIMLQAVLTHQGQVVRTFD